MKTLKVVSLVLVIVFIIGCSEDNITDPASYERGKIISTEELIVIAPELLQLYLSQFEIPQSIEFNHTVSALSIEYQTIDAHGKMQKASGGLIIPQTIKESPLLSIQHGTETERNSVASVLPFSSIEGTVGLITASTGYVTCIPDYLGFGVSTELHPYVHAKSLALSVIDFMRAARTYCEENDILLNEQLFLGGYSEGGYATLATHREIEQNYASEFSITACAPMAGPYDLIGTTKIILSQTFYNSPTYIAFLLTAYNDIYGWNKIDEMFNAPYAGMMNNMFNGLNAYSDINNTLPTEILQLLKENFVNNVLNETDTLLINALQENTLLDWTPAAPIRLFHGDSDETSPYENATTTLQAFQDRGVSDIELITIPGGTHASASLPAVLGMIEWMDTFRD